MIIKALLQNFDIETFYGNVILYSPSKDSWKFVLYISHLYFSPINMLAV